MDRALPWHLPEDLRRFKELTDGLDRRDGPHHVGVLTGEFRPLPGRRNVVVTRQASYDAPGAEVVCSLEDALARADADIWVIGGASIYEQALPLADRVVRTRVHLKVEGDTHAPVLGADWTMVGRDPESGLHKSETGVEYCVATLVRR